MITKTKSTFQNKLYAARCTFQTHYPDYSSSDFNDTTPLYTFSALNVQVWSPPHQAWLSLPDKFHITAPTPELARDEFFRRWSLYTHKRFKRNIYLENIN